MNGSCLWYQHRGCLTLDAQSQDESFLFVFYTNTDSVGAFIEDLLYGYDWYIHNWNYLTAISRFRTSSHSLHIETGRHTVPYTPAENRLCSFCDLNSIDDEMHMLLKCTIHNPERDILIQSIQYLLQRPIYEFTDQDLCCKIMGIKCADGLNAIGKYLYTGFSRRKNSISITPSIQNLTHWSLGFFSYSTLF